MCFGMVCVREMKWIEWFLYYICGVDNKLVCIWFVCLINLDKIYWIFCIFWNGDME